MEKVIPIDDSFLGVLEGRDCIFMQTVMQDDQENLIFRGEINGCLASKIQVEQWIPYRMVFHRVLFYFSCEIDTYENIDKGECISRYALGIVENGRWLKSLPIREDFDKSVYKQYRVVTYDFVFQIIACSYELYCRPPEFTVMQLEM